MIVSSISLLSTAAADAGPDFMPHGFCYLWDPTVLWLNVISDTLIALSYYCIPVVLIYFIRRNRNLPLNAVFWMFATFILACGTTHVLEVWNIWHANYLLSGAIKAVTAIVSVITAVMLIPLAPRLISAPERVYLQDVNRELKEQIAERMRAEQALRVARDSMSGIVASAMDSIITIDEEHNILLFNGAAEKLFRCPASEAVGQAIDRFIPQRFRAAHAGYVEQFGKTGVTSSAMGELRALWAKRADGKEFQIEASISQVESAGKKLFTVILRDVSERVQAAAARERLAAVVDSSEDAIISKSLDGIITSWNKGAEKIFGYRDDEVLGKPMLLLFPPELAQEEADILVRIERRESVKHYETVRLRNDGTKIDVSATISPLRDGTGTIVGASKVLRDITERKRTEAALRESEERFQAMVNGIPQLAWMAEPDGHHIWYNQRWFDYTGTTMEQMEGWGWQRVHDATVLPRVLEAWETVIAKGTSFEMEFPLRAADGTFGIFLTRVVPLKDGNGKVVRWFGTNTDISDRKRAEERQVELARELARHVEELAVSREALEVQTRMLHLVLDSMGEGLVAADPKGRFLIWNNSARKLLGRGPEEITTEQWSSHYGCFELDSITPVPTHRLPLIRAIGGESLQTQIIIRHPDNGAGRFIEFTGRPLKDDRGKLCGGVVAFRDITQTKADEREIHKLNNELEQRVLERTAQLKAANEELEAFTYSVSHDLRAPLRHIAGFTGLLLEESGAQLDDQAQRYVQRIQEGTRKMGQLVDELLSLARIGRQAISSRVVDLNAMVEEVTALLQPEWEGRALEWRVATLPTFVCDPTLTRQVFQNLLSNAIKYSRRREPAVIEVGSSDSNGETAIFVRDNGVGFNMKYSDKLFGVFQRLHRAEEFEGTGVGLAIVHRIIKKHGGRVWAESEIDKGATFYFTLSATTTIDNNSMAATSGMGV